MKVDFVFGSVYAGISRLTVVRLSRKLVESKGFFKNNGTNIDLLTLLPNLIPAE